MPNVFRDLSVRHCQLRQGDLLLESVDKLPKDVPLTPAPKEQGSVILARGESGHAHRIESISAILYQRSFGESYLVLHEETRLVHPEHAPLLLDVGIYRATRQRVYESRPVVDARPVAAASPKNIRVVKAKPQITPPAPEPRVYYRWVAD